MELSGITLVNINENTVVIYNNGIVEAGVGKKSPNSNSNSYSRIFGESECSKRVYNSPNSNSNFETEIRIRPNRIRIESNPSSEIRRIFAKNSNSIDATTLMISVQYPV
jgi:hypothetical protein